MRSLFHKLYKKLPVIAFDIIAIPVAWYLAYWLRYNMKPFPYHLIKHDSLMALFVLMTVQVGCYYYFRVYRGLWLFSSINDVVRIIKAVVTAIMLTVLCLYLGSFITEIPRSVLPLFGLINVFLLCSGRLCMRIYQDKFYHKNKGLEVNRVLIIGAGRAAESLVRDLKRIKRYLPVGLIDDKVSKRGLEIHGIRVLGTTRELVKLVHALKVDLIFIAIPSLTAKAMRRIVALCERCEIPFRTLPSVSDLASGFVQINALREVKLEDLLGRDQVQLQWEKIAESIQDHNIIITGAGGSIGSELCRQIMRQKPAKLMLIDNCEYNLYAIEQELRGLYPEACIEPVLISITDAKAVDWHFSAFMPEIVFHAAAYKHVPMLENQIRAAVQNNILGTQTVANASVMTGVKKFILISTDKAVNPTNIMGTTKRIAEMYCQNINERVDTQFITVRFGNVLGSTGSVVPLFQKQLKSGGPLTVTHPDIERYFMTIPEASQLILQAMVSGLGNEIFVLDMGEPIKIRYLAEQMIRLAGKKLSQDIEIQYTGLRPGEKLYEELFHSSEQLMQTSHEKLFKAQFRKLDWTELSQVMRLLQTACDNYDNTELAFLIRNLVPEFVPERAFT